MNKLPHKALLSAVSYDAQTGLFAWVTSDGRGKAKGSPGTHHRQTGYIYMTVLGKKYLAHRLAWFYAFGKWPVSKIDHFNGDKTDNRLANLREASDSVNSQNQHGPMSTNLLGVMGVSAHGRNYRARITVDYRRIKLGVFETPELAHAAYLKAKRQMHAGNTL